MYTIGIDLGGTNIAVGLCDKELKIVDKGSVPTLGTRPGEEIVADMAKLTEEIIKRNGLTVNDIDYVGIATPGTANSKTGIVEYANNLPFKNFPIADLFKRHLPVNRVIIDNDANAAALGEALAGAAKNTKSSVMITLGTGVGGGIIIDGKIFAGGLNCSGAELGHTVIKAGGRQCSCGRRGCFEAYVNNAGLKRIAAEAGVEGAETMTHAKLFDMNTPNAERAKELYVKYFAGGITNLINLFQLEEFVLEGSFTEAGEKMMKPMMDIILREQFTHNMPNKCNVRLSNKEAETALLGAALLGR